MSIGQARNACIISSPRCMPDLDSHPREHQTSLASRKAIPFSPPASAIPVLTILWSSSTFCPSFTRISIMKNAANNSDYQLQGGFSNVSNASVASVISVMNDAHNASVLSQFLQEDGLSDVASSDISQMRGALRARMGSSQNSGDQPNWGEPSS